MLILTWGSCWTKPSSNSLEPGEGRQEQNPAYLTPWFQGQRPETRRAGALLGFGDLIVQQVQQPQQQNLPFMHRSGAMSLPLPGPLLLSHLEF